MASEGARLELAVFSARGMAVHPLVPGKQLVVGRGDDVDIVIDDVAVSRRHAIFHVDVGSSVELEDLGSSNGTSVSRAASPDARSEKTADHKRLTVAERTALGPGDTVHFGAALVVVRPAPRAVTAVEEPPASVLQGFDAIVREPALVRIYEEAARAAPMSLPVLVLGETGVGKDVLARFIHHRSPRASGPFVARNCATFGEALADSELFGHEKGAFTGAQHARPGLFESANGGTVFLDEIGELPLPTQAKLLRTLESSEVQRIGGGRPIKLDVRLVSATNRDLERASAHGTFRQDLYYRVNGISLHIPPLRERPSEIVELARRFLDAPSRQIGLTEIPAIADDARRALEAYAWPGNVRELRFVMERAVVSAGKGPIERQHLPPQVLTSPAPAPALSTPAETATRDQVIEALAACDGNQTRAAERLGVSRRTLINRMIEFNLPRPRKG